MLNDQTNTKRHAQKQQISTMFNNIAPSYDLLNHLLSFGIDIYWRKRAIRLLKPLKPKLILDVATGTADFAIEAMNTKPDKVTGIDIAEKMLEIGRKKIERKKLQDKIGLLSGNCEKLQFQGNYFDAVIVAFGVRNFEDLQKGLTEMYRVTKPGGAAVILEFSKPKGFPFRQMYNFYFNNILPLVGKVVSKNNSAYNYLPQSVKAFPDGKDFVKILEKIGYRKTRYIPLTFGVCSIYMGEK